MLRIFEDRTEAGRALAEKLSEYKNRDDVVVLGLPRGGVPVAFEVAQILKAPMDILTVRKLGVPGQEELAFGAIASGGITVFNESLVHSLRMPPAMLERVVEEQQKELERRERLYGRNASAAPELRGKTVIIADDGLATGATMRAAVTAVKMRNPAQVIVAAPVASADVCRDFESKANALCVCVMSPEPFYGVGRWYRNFEQTTDEEVSRLLEKSANDLSPQKIKHTAMT
jgi:putative phosphoribosyl transferase